ncbi:precorrin-6A synthase [Nocardioides luteus]|uniref:Precorrin-6A synthase (Deacetylating) n=1 Tax=Nocardioides luteus TaxID=1844 RepID=A0ABQ5T2E0_9ACTN|nr:precorrin-6A synthase (deacetylating) [Nocardioides luteus]MDR7311615.1 precorrin-6A synthase [Nocardioides luteus]GGR54393.1 precorrin-6A synthase (deacetylating) [Nocardioides luteus]GLJ70264.1 precorrin-6A synthase (deacetylating) [Nocardioides luteus]
MTTSGKRRIKIIGVGPGDPDQVTLEAVAAMRSVDYFLVTDKSGTVKGGMPDPLVRAREELLDRHLSAPARVVKVDDAPRERRAEFTGTDADYQKAVADWHRARVERYLAILDEHPGDVGFLVWGDPAFYDSTIRVVDQIAAEREVEVDVITGISSVQLLAARHRIVLHEVGRPLYVTTGRAALDAVEAGHDNIVVMLNRVVDLPGLDDWRIWWGGNLGTREEELVAGTVGEVLPAIEEARSRLRDAAGWVMDIYLLRAPR